MIPARRVFRQPAAASEFRRGKYEGVSGEVHISQDTSGGQVADALGILGVLKAPTMSAWTTRSEFAHGRIA